MYFQYVLKEISKRRARAAAHIMSVAIITVLMVSLTAIMGTYSSAIYLPFENSGADMVLQKQDNSTTGTSGIGIPFGRGLFSEDELSSIESLDHVQDSSSSLVLWNFNHGSFTSIEGIERSSFMEKRLGSWLKNGNFSIGGGYVVLENHFANFYHESVGDIMTLSNRTYEIAGIIRFEEGSDLFASNIYMSLEDAQRLSGLSSINQIYLKIDSLPNEDTVRSSIIFMDKGINTLSEKSISTSLNNVASIFDKFYLIGLVIILMISALLLFKINAAGLLERRRDVGVLQSVGWQRRNIIGQFCSEALIQTVLGFSIGVLASFAIISALSMLTINVPSGALGSNEAISVPLSMPMASILTYLLIFIAISLAVSFALARKAASVRPSNNMRKI